MASSVIGALRVNLGIDTAAFSDGLKSATSQLAKTGKSMQSLGSTLTARVTAPLVAAAGVIGVGLGQMSKGLADLTKQAAIAGVTVEEFQRLAYAAKTVGVEQEKLSDILKDVNDKVGDFMATGGGEMKAFFEEIAPKVGVTAEMFKNLSSADALGLYVSTLEKAGVSQAEMTFFMEAIADEATALVPILSNGGAELQRLGDKAASFGLISEETAKSASAFNEAMQGLQAAMAGLGKVLVDSGALEALTGLVTKITEWIQYLGQANPEIVRFGAVIAVIAAAVGPLVVGLGLLVAAVAAIGVPVAAAIAGIAALTAGVVAFWPEIVAAKDALVQFAVEGVAFVIAKFTELQTYLSGLSASFMQIGRDVIDGLMAGLREKWESVRVWFTGLADSLPQWLRDAWGIKSPSRVFAEIGGHVMDGLRQGLGSQTGGVQAEMQSFASSIGQIFANVLTQGASLKDGLRNLGLQTLGNIGGGMLNKGVSGIAGLFGLPGFANGTRFAPGGLAMVGERGPELVTLPRGARVTPNDKLGGGSNVVNLNLNVAGARGNQEIQQMVAAGVAQGMAQVRREVPGIVTKHQLRNG